MGSDVAWNGDEMLKVVVEGFRCGGDAGTYDSDEHLEDPVAIE